MIVPDVINILDDLALSLYCDASAACATRL